MRGAWPANPHPGDASTRVRHTAIDFNMETIEMVSAKNEHAHILIVVTSNSKLGKTGRLTGLWLEELAAPYNLFEDAGFEVTIASPLGGVAPIDEASLGTGFVTNDVTRFQKNSAATQRLADTVPLGAIDNMAGFGAIFLVDHATSSCPAPKRLKFGEPSAPILVISSGNQSNQAVTNRTNPGNREDAALQALEPVRAKIPAIEKRGHTHRHHDPRGLSFEQSLPHLAALPRLHRKSVPESLLEKGFQTLRARLEGASVAPYAFIRTRCFISDASIARRVTMRAQGEGHD